MCSKLNLVIVIVGLFLAGNADAEEVQPDFTNGADVLNYILESRDLIKADSDRSIECFAIWIPVMNENAEVYKTNYQTCITGSDASRQAVDDATKEKRDAMDSEAKQSCDLLDICKQKADTVEYFSCIQQGSASNSKSMDKLSNNAADVKYDVQQNYQIIDNNFWRCSNTSARIYEERNQEAYNNMNKCITGSTPLPTTTTGAPGTSAPTTSPTEETSAPTTGPTEETSAPTTGPTEETPAPGKLREDVRETFQLHHIRRHRG